MQTLIKPVFLLLLLTLHTVDGRENPFLPATQKDSYTLTDNNYTALQPLKRVAMSLPTSARIVKSMRIEYINLDGSMATKEIPINQSVDWHLPLFLSQSFKSQSSIKPVNRAKQPIAMAKRTSMQTLSPFFSFTQQANRLTMFTTDPILRHFGLSQPNRIVIDFKRDANFRTLRREIASKYFLKMQLGNHKGYYRCVIELDGLYGYRLIPNKGRIDITLQ